MLKCKHFFRHHGMESLRLLRSGLLVNIDVSVWYGKGMSVYKCIFSCSFLNAANSSNLYCLYFKAKYDAPVAVYCGSVPKVKPRCRALRAGSIDSNLQLCGSRWITEEGGEDGRWFNVWWQTYPNRNLAFRKKSLLEVSSGASVSEQVADRDVDDPALLWRCSWHHIIIISSLCFILYQ